MKTLWMLTSATFLALGSMAAQAGNLDLNLNSDAVQFEANGNLAPNIALGGGLLSSDDNEDVTALHAQLLGTESTRDYDIGVGVRWSQYDTDYGDGGGLGLGGYGYVYVPSIPRLSLGGYGFYTPGVVATQDLEDSLEYGLRARYQVVRNVDAYVGYRRVEAEFDNRSGDRTLDSGALAGLRLTF
nr:YfaZ family outer membrane protein [uncultured Halomonas sp.]